MHWYILNGQAINLDQVTNIQIRPKEEDDGMWIAEVFYTIRSASRWASYSDVYVITEEQRNALLTYLRRERNL